MKLELQPLEGFMPIVSVVIPVFNGARFLSEALESVFMQTWDNYEVICVDDGSTDDSMAVLRRYSERVQIIAQVNAGESVARNAGVRHSAGAYVAFLDQDDRWYPHKLEQQVSCLEANSDVVMVHCDMDWIDEAGRIIQRNIGLAAMKSVQRDPLTMTRLVGWDPCIYPSTMLIRRTAFDHVGGFDPELRSWGGDIELMLRLRQEGRFVLLEEAGTQYRKHSGNTSDSRSDVMLQYKEQFFRKLQTFYAGDSRKQALLKEFLAKAYSDWGKVKMSAGSYREARHLLLHSLKHCPWELRTYGRLLRATLPRFS